MLEAYKKAENYSGGSGKCTSTKHAISACMHAHQPVVHSRMHAQARRIPYIRQAYSPGFSIFVNVVYGVGALAHRH